MTEKIAHIRNPLTVVAIFAGIAEVSGSAVLPFIGPAEQHRYIWFLIGFPTYLVTLFFAVLLWKHRVLYAPSDFKDDSSFMALLTPASIADKLTDIDAEVVANAAFAGRKSADSTSHPEAPTPDTQPHSSEEPPRAKLEVTRNWYLAAEELAISRLSRDYGFPFQRNVSLSFANTASHRFDAVAMRDGVVWAVEVAVAPATTGAATWARRVFEKTKNYYNALPEAIRPRVRFTVVMVFGEAIDSQIARVAKFVTTINAEYPFVKDTRIYSLDELQKAASA